MKKMLAVLRNPEGHIETVRTVPMHNAPAGIVLTHDGSTLIAAAGGAVVFFDVERLETGAAAPSFQWVSDGPQAGSIYLNTTADDRTLFVSDSDRFNTHTAAASKLMVLDTTRIGTRLDPKIGEIPCGAFPREFSPWRA
jgi:hypothetical protein